MINSAISTPADRPYKPLVMFIDLQRLYAAKPTAEEIASCEAQGAYLPTAQEIQRVEDIIAGCKALADYLRASLKIGAVQIGWAAMAPKTSFMVTNNVDEFRALLVSNDYTQYDFYQAEPRDGDLFAAKTENSVMSNPDFMQRVHDEGFTDIYFAGFQATECALGSGLKDTVMEKFKETALGIQTAIISNLSADTFGGKSVFRPMPSEQAVLEILHRSGARVVTTHECIAEIHFHLGRPVAAPSNAADSSAKPVI